MSDKFKIVRAAMTGTWTAVKVYSWAPDVTVELLRGTGGRIRAFVSKEKAEAAARKKWPSATKVEDEA